MIASSGVCNLLDVSRRFHPGGHALNCPFGGFPKIRHGGIRDFTAKLIREVCHHVVVEPTLQPLTNESLHPASVNISDAARLDVKADVFGTVISTVHFSM